MRDVLGTLRRLPVWLRVLLVGQFVSAVGGLAWLYMTLYLVEDRGLATSRAGLVVALYGIGTITGNLTGGWLGDHLGLRKGLLITIGGWVLACVAVPFVPTVLLAAAVAVAGLVGGMTRPIMGALVTSCLPGELRRPGIALWRAVSNAGTILGPPIGALLSAYSFNLIFVVDALTSAVLWAVIRARVPRTAVEQVRAARTRLRVSPSVLGLLAGIVVIDTVYRLQYSVVPLWLRDQGAPTVAYGLLISMNCVIIVAGEAIIAVRLRHRPALLVIGAGFVLVGLGYLVLSAPFGLAAAVGMMVVVTAGEMLYKPTATAHVADAAPPGLAGRYQSLYGAASICGTMLSPALGTALYAVAPAAVWPVAGAVGLAAGAFTLVAGRRAAIGGDVGHVRRA
ncbi:MFS transporter [Hamadaea tsunoensis]|uniref:MFS transporter n=1 Tax=Hamadaea tsunoensis TaxID=53368 RepID=UPI00040976F1|nr:MFS transporter [Hamadaea tsunoensis]